MLLSLGVTGLLLLWSWLAYQRAGRILSATTVPHPLRPLADMEIDGVPVTVTESIGPATVGAWNARVLLPRWVLRMPAEDRRFVLVHEHEHRKAGDTRLLFLASLLACLFPFILPIWWQLRRLGLAVEVDCDRRVVQALGNAERYQRILFDVATTESARPHLQPAFLGRPGSLEWRMRRMIDREPPGTHARLLALTAGSVLLLAAFATPHPACPHFLNIAIGVHSTR